MEIFQFANSQSACWHLPPIATKSSRSLWSSTSRTFGDFKAQKGGWPDFFCFLSMKNWVFSMTNWDFPMKHWETPMIKFMFFFRAWPIFKIKPTACLGSDSSHYCNVCAWWLWVNYNISLTWTKAIWGWFPLIINHYSQWGRSEVVIIYPDGCNLAFVCHCGVINFVTPKLLVKGWQHFTRSVRKFPTPRLLNDLFLLNWLMAACGLFFLGPKHSWTSRMSMYERIRMCVD